MNLLKKEQQKAKEIKEGEKMAKIIENRKGRRIIRLNTSDIIDIVREYQNITYGAKNYLEIRDKLNNHDLYIPEDIL